MNRFEDFLGLIYSIQKHIEKIKKHKMKEFGLGGNHVMCLYYLARNEQGLTAAELSKVIAVDKAATSRALSELVEKGLIAYPNAEGQKKYRAVAVLTEQGTAVAGQMDAIIGNVLDTIGTGLSDEERQQMYRSLALVEHDLTELTKTM